MPFRAYYKEINKNLRSGSTERSYYAGFQNLLQALSNKVEVFTEHGKIDVGHPDFEARLKQKAADFPIGWIEAKNPGEDLKKIERTDQLKRYLGLHSLILTDFIEFRWYRDGKQVLKARLGTIQRKRLQVDPKGEAAVRELLEQFLATEFAPPRTPGELAKRMAGLAHVIREITLQTYEKEKETGELHAQYQSFSDTLIPDLSPEQFADMYAQTITYGLFAAACQLRFPPGNENGQRASPAKQPRSSPWKRRSG